MLLFGALAGYISANRAIESRGQVLEGSGWRSWQDTGSDPYVLAHFLNEGVLPPDKVQWRVYETAIDSSGDDLDSDCVYTLSGAMPESRWWRLSAEGSGSPVGAEHKSWVQSDTAILEPDGTVRIAVSPLPRPANWLMPANVSGLRLMLFVLEERKGSKPPPAVERISCP